MKPTNYSFYPVTSCNMCGSREFNMLGMRLNRSQGKRPKTASGIAVAVKQCANCSLIFSDPLPVPEKLSDHYGMPADTYWPEEHFQPNSDYFQSEIAVAKRRLGFTPGMTALDIGVGLGKAFLALSTAGFDVWGIEPSAEFRDVAVLRMGVPDDRVQLETIENASFDPDRFDFITFGAVLEHLPDPANAIREAVRWLKPGGVIQIEVPSSGFLMSKLINLYFSLRGTNYVTHLSPMHPPFHLYEFSLKSFQEAGRRDGYEIAEHGPSPYCLRSLPFGLRQPLRKLMDMTDRGMQLTVWLHRRI